MYKASVGAIGALWCAAAFAASPEIARVENGLLPPVAIAGEPLPAMNIADRLTHHRVPALSVAVIDGGRLAWARAYGTSNPALKAPATVETLFQAGSLSKPVTAAGALLLVRDGKLSLNGPIEDHLRSWRLPASETAGGAPVTLRRLLSHTAGTTVHGFRGYAAGEPVPTLQQILDGTPPANSEAIRVDRTPGSALRYSGGGYVIVQQAIEDVTGRPFAEVMRDRLLDPLGMTDSSFAQPLPHALVGRAAVGHARDGAAIAGGWHIFPEQAPAGLWSTPSDLARFALSLMDGLKPGAAEAQQAVAAAMTEPQKDSAGTYFPTPGGSHAGLGLVLEGEGPTLRFSHAGSNPGQKAFMIGFPETGQGAVLMANSDSSPALLQEVLRAIAAEYRWPERFHKVVER